MYIIHILYFVYNNFHGNIPSKALRDFWMLLSPLRVYFIFYLIGEFVHSVP